MTNGPVNRPVPSSRRTGEALRAFATTDATGAGRWSTTDGAAARDDPAADAAGLGGRPPSASAHGSPMTALADGFAFSSSTWPREESMVPPLNPPRMLRTARWVRPSSAPSARAASAQSRTPRSLGTESKPQAWTMRAPVRRAASWFAAMLSWTKRTSPVRSQ